MSREERFKNANDLINVISATGRKFFNYPDGVSHFVIGKGNRVSWHDAYTGKQYHPEQPRARRSHEGGTLQALISYLHRYIVHGDLLPPLIFGPWPMDFCNGDLWGYGADMETVRRNARALGVLFRRGNA